jgi:hypothetical protein
VIQITRLKAGGFGNTTFGQAAFWVVEGWGAAT